MKSRRRISEGSYVLLYLDSRRRWLVKASKGGKVHTHVGYVELDNLLERRCGVHVSSSRGAALYALEPTIYDFVMKAERRTQIVYPKDMGLIAVKLGIASGSKVVEAGTGSGVLCMFLANLVKPRGHIYSYEIRREFMKIAEKNLEKAGLLKYVTLKEADAKEGLDVKDSDAAVIDVGDPWSLVKPMREALKGGGMLAAVSPTVNQVERLTSELEACGFVDIETVELLERRLEARTGMTRPSTRMIGHTAYLTFARKTLAENEVER